MKRLKNEDVMVATSNLKMWPNRGDFLGFQFP